jgi:hypothetical protein
MNRSYGVLLGRLSGLSVILGSACLVIAMLLSTAGSPASAADTLDEVSPVQEESTSPVPVCTRPWRTPTTTPVPPDTDTPTPTEAPPTSTLTEVPPSETPTQTDTLTPPTETLTPTVTPTETVIPPTSTATPTGQPPTDTATPTSTEAPPSQTPTPTPTDISQRPSTTPTATRTGKPPVKSLTPTSTVPAVPEATATPTWIIVRTPAGTLPPPTPPSDFVYPPIIVPVTGAEMTPATASARFIPIFLNLGIGLLGIGLVTSGLARRLRREDDPLE